MRARVLAVLGLFLLSGPVRGGNQDTYFLGNDAAMTGGSVSAVADDAGAAWYNPAGLGGVRRNILELTASAFMLRVTRLPVFVRFAGEGAQGQAGADMERLQSVPSALVMTRQLSGEVTGALGIFVPSMMQNDAHANLRMGPGAEQTIFLDAHQEASLYHLGAAVGWRLLPRLRLGGALMVIYYDYDAAVQMSAGSRFERGGEDVQAFLFQWARSYGIRIGGQAVFGLQWEPLDGWHLGLVIRSPIFQFYHAGFAAAEIGGVGDPTRPEEAAVLESFSQDINRWSFSEVLPARAHLGLAYRFRRGFVGLEADVRPGTGASEDVAPQAFVWNLRCGGRLAVSDKLALGGGLFTDRSSEKDAGSFGAWDVDFYGITLGAELFSPHALAKNPDDPQGLVFSTTIAVRYAVGLGRAAGLSFNLQEQTRLTSVVEPVDVTIHEISLHLGSALYF